MDFQKLIDWAEKKLGRQLPRWVYVVVVLVGLAGIIGAAWNEIRSLFKSDSKAPLVNVTNSPGSIVAPSGGNNSIKNFFTDTEKRPWISITPEIDGVEWGRDGARFHLRFLLQNTGRNPAKHVGLEVATLPSMTLDRNKTAYNWIVQRLEASKHSPMHLGFPIYPGVPVISNFTGSFPTEEVEQFRQLRTVMKHNADDPPLPPTPYAKLTIPIAVAYFVDYDDGKTKYQSYCWASVNWLDPSRPYVQGLSLPFNKNLPRSELGLFEQSYGCGAE
jgi:hypothetical protein